MGLRSKVLANKLSESRVSSSKPWESNAFRWPSRAIVVDEDINRETDDKLGENVGTVDDGSAPTRRDAEQSGSAIWLDVIFSAIVSNISHDMDNRGA